VGPRHGGRGAQAAGARGPGPRPRAAAVALGGSQGARCINDWLRTDAGALVEGGVQVLHQVGPGRADEAAPAAPGYRAVEYVDDVVEVLRAATLVVCRGGASTLAEVAAAGVPAVVVPYPHHVDRHQEHNARELGRGVRIVDEARATAELTPLVLDLVRAPRADERARMRAELGRRVPRDGSRRLLEALRLSSR